MNDQSQMMSQQAIMINQAPPSQVMGQGQVQVQPQLMGHSQAMNPAPMGQSQPMSSAQMMNQPPLMMNRAYKAWPHPNMKFSSLKPNFAKPNNRSNNWKGKKIPSMENRRMEKFEMPMMMPGGAGASGVGSGGTQGYIPPVLNDLQYQNRLKARKFYNKKKFNNNGRFAPYAPRNTTSFIIRAKKSGGITSMVSPCPVTPAVLPTPVPWRTQVVGDVNEEVVENGSDNENESDGGGSDIRVTGVVDNEEIEFVAANEEAQSFRNVDLGVKAEKNFDLMHNQETKDVCMKEIVPEVLNVKEDEKKNEIGRDEGMKVEAVKSEIGQGEIVVKKEDGTKGEGTYKMVTEEGKDESRHESENVSGKI